MRFTALLKRSQNNGFFVILGRRIMGIFLERMIFIKLYEKHNVVHQEILRVLYPGMTFKTISDFTRYIQQTCNPDIIKSSFSDQRMLIELIHCAITKKNKNGDIVVEKVLENILPPLFLRKDFGGNVFKYPTYEYTEIEMNGCYLKDIIERNPVLKKFYNPELCFHKGIYLIYNHRTKESYVGSCSNSFLERLRVHYCESNKNNQAHTYELIHKEDTYVYTLHFCDEMSNSDILSVEQKYIDKLLFCEELGYNVVNISKKTGYFYANELSIFDIDKINEQVKLGNDIEYIYLSKVGFKNKLSSKNKPAHRYIEEVNHEVIV